MEKINGNKIFNKYYENISKKYPILLKNKKDINNSENKKQKGFTKIFRSLIKKKNNALKNVLENRFNLWKKEAFKDIFIRKTVLVRISVSRDKINNNRNANKLNNINNLKENRPKSADKNMKIIKKKDEKEKKTKNINIINLKKEPENKSPKKVDVNLTKTPNDKNNNKNKKSIFNISSAKETQKNKSIYSTPINNMKHNPAQYLKEISKNKEEKPAPIIYSYYPIKGKNNISKNTFITNYLKKNNDQNGYNSYTNVLASKKKNFTNNARKNYDEKKYTPLKKNISETKLYDKKKDIRNTYTKKNVKNFGSVDSGRKYNNYTAKKENIRKPKLDNENLKKGITTVIQHYLGVKERLDNYNLVPILN